MKLGEIFNSSINLTRQHTGRYELAGVSVNEVEYVIQVETRSLPFDELTEKRTAEISFFRNIPNAERAHSTTHDQPYPASVYGIVMNALKSKFQEYDAFLFTVLRRHSSSDSEFDTKRRIYSFVADRIAKDVGAHILEQEEPDGVVYLVTKVGVVSETLLDRWTHIRSLTEQLTFTPFEK